MLEFIFWIGVAFVAHSYVLFPFILKILSANKKQNLIIYDFDATLPDVHIVLSIYNAANVLEQKLQSMYDSNYPKDKIHLWIGSDNSTDNSIKIIEKFSSNQKNINFFQYSERRGKSQVLNDLYLEIQKSEPSENAILILTDASVFFTENTIYELVKHFKNATIGLVGANIIPPTFKKDGISFQEKAYAKREIKIKYREGLIWGTVMGVWGTCYAIRNKLYTPIPKNHLVDDFFVTLKILQKKFVAIYELNAICYQDVPNDSKIEYARKIRISTGNFQNIAVFSSILWKPFSGIGFCFWSHKVFRWLTWLFMLATFFSSMFLALNSEFYAIIFALQFVALFTPAVNNLLGKLNIHLKLIRFIAHFYAMNFAMFIGFVRYVRGINSGVWTPTPR